MAGQLSTAATASSETPQDFPSQAPPVTPLNVGMEAANLGEYPAPETIPLL
eukprot:CAMPEP_0171712022 /NCGR_PEP_ID=MMETSP0991-20121206/16940_1 /TAXON_ID=483369 /ORGANISM="non described non described, Strain CCMP2098" /LENGTH=50 /DNA_ID=CAMNT_0012302469 /DNA_START=262 /DNA_END=410 /DNA_ORIENTATION=-